MIFSQHPLIAQLSKLRESSKEAVANAEIILDDDLKSYLHIRRKVQNDLESMVVEAGKLSHSVLLLVCGNVGDGKSHLLSKLKESEKVSSSLEKFKVYNDATESFSPDETSNDSLSRILSPFADENLGNDVVKIILAINLGTLSNFLEEKKDSFSKLRSYVERNKIIESDFINKSDREDSDVHFDFVNFTNRHFFNLGSEGAIVTPIVELLTKVTAEKDDNPIYQGYLAAKKQSWGPLCPVVKNYEFLSVESYREVVAQLLITCLVKEKQIISFRQLLNFVYDMLVPFQIAQLEAEKYGIILSNLSVEKRLEYTTPYYLFENPKLSKIFFNLYQHDPIIRRYEVLDEAVILLFTEHDPLSWLNTRFANIVPSEASVKAAEKIKHDVLVKAFLRFEYFNHSNNVMYLDDYFKEYLQALYAYNNCDAIGLRKAMELVKKAAYSWNGGTSDTKKISVPSSVKNSPYRIFREIDLKGNLPKEIEHKHQKEITEFKQEIVLRLSSTNEYKFEIAIDYSLYVLLKKVSLGYRPNKLDRYTYINFDRFVEQATFSDIDGEELFVDQINFGAPLDYKFEYDDEYDEFTFTKIPKL